MMTRRLFAFQQFFYAIIPRSPSS